MVLIDNFSRGCCPSINQILCPLIKQLLQFLLNSLIWPWRSRSYKYQDHIQFGLQGGLVQVWRQSMHFMNKIHPLIIKLYPKGSDLTLKYKAIFESRSSLVWSPWMSGQKGWCVEVWRQYIQKEKSIHSETKMLWPMLKFSDTATITIAL